MKSFQSALKQRVKKDNKIKPDKYSLEKIVRQTMEGLFGKAGGAAIRFSTNQKEKIFLASNRSVWRSELKLNVGKIKKSLEEKDQSGGKYQIIITE